MDMLNVDLNDLTIAEIETIEEIIDAPLDSVGKPGARKGKFLRAVAFVVGRRDNPEFSLEDAGNTRISVGQGDSATDPHAPAEQ